MDGLVSAFIGRIGQEPTKRYTQSGKSLLNISVAVQDSKAPEGTPTQWVKVSVWGDLADQLAESLAKGAEVYCEGRLQLERWQAQDGVERSGLKLNAWRVDPVGQIGRRAPRTERQDGASPLMPQSAAIPPRNGSQRVSRMAQEELDDLPF